MPHPDYLLRMLTSRQLAEWMVFYEQAPFGQDISDMMTAQVAALVFNANRGKSTTAAKPSDFLPRKPEVQTPEQIKHTLRSVLRGSR